LQNPSIGEVRGLGCMIGVEFVDAAGAADGRLCGELIQECLAKGLILIGCGLKRNIARFVPPLTVSAGEMDEALGIFSTALAELS
jgi:4-aminobutyrate aminotransferase